MKRIYLYIALLIVAGCGGSPDIKPEMLDGAVIFDPSVNNPEDYLLSFANPSPDALEVEKPVFITLHGYSATTFEWDEFREWSKDNLSNYFISQVLLGAHGMTYEDFKKATWKDWQHSIIAEYDRLILSGYKNLNIVCSSTSCTLVMELIASGYFNNKTAPVNILMVDPLVIPSAKSLSLVGIIGPVLGYVEADNTTDEDRYYYHFRPQESLQQLQKVANEVRRELEVGITLPENCRLKVYKSKKDPTADPVGAVLIYKGMKTYLGESIDVEMIDSDLHVFTRLSLRESVTAKDQQNQENAFNDFLSRAGL